MALAVNVTHLVAMVDPALPRLVRRSGVEFRSLGAPVQHHGLRQPGWAAVGQLLDRVRDCLAKLWEFATAARAAARSGAF